MTDSKKMRKFCRVRDVYSSFLLQLHHIGVLDDVPTGLFTRNLPSQEDRAHKVSFVGNRTPDTASSTKLLREHWSTAHNELRQMNVTVNTLPLEKVSHFEKLTMTFGRRYWIHHSNNTLPGIYHVHCAHNDISGHQSSGLEFLRSHQQRIIC